MGRTSCIIMPSMVGIVGRAPAVDEKVWCFFLFLFFFMSRFGITKFVLTETPWCSVIFKTIMVPLHRGKFLLCTYIQVSLCTPEFFSWGQIYTKNCYFGGFRRPYGHIFKATMVKVRTTVGDLGVPPPCQILSIVNCEALLLLKGSR